MCWRETTDDIRRDGTDKTSERNSQGIATNKDHQSNLRSFGANILVSMAIDFVANGFILGLLPKLKGLVAGPSHIVA